MARKKGKRGKAKSVRKKKLTAAERALEIRRLEARVRALKAEQPKKPKKSKSKPPTARRKEKPRKAPATKRAPARTAPTRPARKPGPARIPLRPARPGRLRLPKPFRQPVYRDPKTGHFISRKKGERRKKRVTREIIDRAIPSEIRHLSLADGTRIKESDYRRLRALFETMKGMGYDLTGFRTIQDIQSEYSDPERHPPRRRSRWTPGSLTPEQRAERLGDRMIRTLRERRAS